MASAGATLRLPPTIMTKPASVRERRIATVLAVVLVAITTTGLLTRSGNEIVTAPLLAAFAGSTGLSDAITSALLFMLYRADRQRLVLFAACAYLLNSLLVIPYALTFPGIVDNHGYIGNEQSAAFLLLVWHFVFAVAIGLGNGIGQRTDGDRNVGLRMALSTILFAALLTAYATIGQQHLPNLVHNRHFSPTFRTISGLTCGLNVAVAIFVARTPVFSSLRLWLVIALIASALGTGLNGLAPGRFTATWIVGKADQFITASVVLISLLGVWSSLQMETKAATARLITMFERERDLQDNLDREHRASTAFQQAALPRSMPSVPNLLFSAVYRAADAHALVGGDWYDAFRIDDGRIVISVGDVMGNGLTAAVTMNAMRQAVRGAAQLYPDPVAILDAADRVLRSERPDSIVTAFVGVVDPVTRLLSFASAGHPPALLRSPDGTVATIGASGLPLGLRAMLQFDVESTQTILLPDGALLVLYTDGLTEAKRDVVQGESRLRELLVNDAFARADDPALMIANELFDSAQDDVAIMTVLVGDLTLRESAEGSRTTRWSFPAAERDRAIIARAEIIGALVARGATETEIATTGLIFSELVGNVYRHCNGEVDVVLDASIVAPVLHVLDRGPGFTYVSRLPRSVLSESGRGLFIVSNLARDFSITSRPGGGSHARVVLPFDIPTVASSFSV